MARRTKSSKQAADILERLASEEAITLLRLLLDKHPELRPEIEGMAKNVMSSKRSGWAETELMRPQAGAGESNA